MTKFYLLVKRFLPVLFLVSCVNMAFAQERTVSGKVTSADDGSSVPGVNILEKGTSNGTVSDADGNYRISVGNNATLVFSFVGYATQEMAVGSQSVVNISMASDVQALQEVVVIGYGQVEARDVTGTLVSLKSKDFNPAVLASPEALMQGRVAGVQITSNSGEPGAQNTIRIRGTSSVTGGNQPLYVVDGVPITNDDIGNGSASGSGATPARNPLNFLNPNDIASMDVLKDASATAIYGSRGANGVVMITTKKGKMGAPQLNFTYQASVANISKKYDLLNKSQFLAAYDTYNGAGSSAGVNRGGDTDWQDAILRQAFSSQYGLSYGGGDKTGSYMFSAGYLNQEGIIKNSGLQRFSLRFNGDKKFMNDKLLISTSFTVAQTHDDIVPVTVNSGFEGDLWGNALKQNPTNPIYDNTDPAGFFQLANTEPNPVAMLALSKTFINSIRGLGSIAAEYEIVKGLKFKTIYGFDRTTSQRRGAFSKLLNVTGVYGVGRSYTTDTDQSNQLWENYLNYEKNFGNVKFSGLLGYSYQSFSTYSSSFEMSRFRTAYLDDMFFNLASSDQGALGGIVGTNSSYEIDELQSFYGRFNVGISDKYLFTATVRADGSTRFGGDNKYGIFPSVAFKWRMSDESFVPEVFSDLNFRISYGITGNQQFGHNLYTRRGRYQNWTINTAANGVNGGGYADTFFKNEALKWEQTSQFNTGFDFGLMDGKLRGTIDFYRKNTTDLLTLAYSAQPAPSPYVWKNLPANIINQGVELTLEADAIHKTDFVWTVSFNMAYNSNEVTNLNTFYNAGEINGQGLSGAYSQRIADGQPLYSFFVREFAGFAPASSPTPGIAQYAGGDVQKFVGKSPLPKWNLGLSNTFTYKQFDLNIFFTGQLGQYVYSNTANAFFTAGSLANGRNTTTDIPGNGEDKLNAPDVSTRFLYDASFVRLQNLTLGYNFKPNTGVFQNLRLFITGSNLAVFTSYPYQDPEVSVPKPVTLGSTPPISVAGIDYTTYPRARSWMFGLSATF